MPVLWGCWDGSPMRTARGQAQLQSGLQSVVSVAITAACDTRFGLPGPLPPVKTILEIIFDSYIRRKMNILVFCMKTLFDRQGFSVLFLKESMLESPQKCCGPRRGTHGA